MAAQGQDSGGGRNVVRKIRCSMEGAGRPSAGYFTEEFPVLTFSRSAGLLLIAAVVCAASQAPAPVSRTVETEMRNVEYHFTDHVAIHILELRGQLVPTAKHEYPVFDDKNSFTIAIAGAEISISTESLANALNSYIFSGHESPLKGVSIEMEKGLVHVKGKLRSKGGVPFETAGTLATTADGKVVLHSEKIKALHVPVKGLMDLFNIDTGDVVDTSKLPGIDAEKDDLVLDPALILPPPHISGAVKAVRVEGQNIVLTIGGKAEPLGTAPAKNFMVFRGNRLAFGRLLMNDTDMAIVDTTPNDPFDFFLDHYKDQLAAGYTKISPAFSLHVYMPDFDKLVQKKAAIPAVPHAAGAMKNSSTRKPQNPAG